MKLRAPIALVALTLLAASPAGAGPRGIDDCEAIKEANAYNNCLASFGPTRGQHGATYPGVATEGGKSVPAGKGWSNGRHGHGYASHGQSRHGGVRRSGGRMRMEFSPRR